MYNLVNTLNGLNFATYTTGVNMYNNALGLIIKQIRETNNLSQFQLANLSNISRTTLTMIESGKRMPTHLQLLELSRALNFDLIALSKSIYEYKTFEHYLITTKLIAALDSNSLDELVSIFENSPLIEELNYGSPLILKTYCECLIYIYHRNEIELPYNSAIEFFDIDLNNLHKFKPKLNMPNYYYSMFIILSNCLSLKENYEVLLTLELTVMEFLEYSYFGDNLPILELDTFHNKFYIIILNNLADTYFTLNRNAEALEVCNKAIKFSNKLDVLSLLPLLLKMKTEILYNLGMTLEAKEIYQDFKSFCRTTDRIVKFDSFTEVFKLKYPLLFSDF